MPYLVIAAGVLGCLVAVIAVIGWVGQYRWRAVTRDIHLRMAMQAGRQPPELSADEGRDRLPGPVRRYLRHVLGDGGRLIRQVRMRQTGTFNMSESGENWRPFSAEQWVIVNGPAFDWDARIQAAPWVPVRVHDAYVDGEGLMSAAVFGLFPVVQITDGEGTARGELMRFLAETPWYPTLLLPGNGVNWRDIDDRTAEASLTDGRHTVRMTFGFNADDLLSEVRAEARDRLVAGRRESSPWHGRFWDYRNYQGILVPTAGEVAWVLPDGEKPYWRGRLQTIQFDFTTRH